MGVPLPPMPGDVEKVVDWVVHHGAAEAREVEAGAAAAPAAPQPLLAPHAPQPLLAPHAIERAFGVLERPRPVLAAGHDRNVQASPSRWSHVSRSAGAISATRS